MNTSEVIDLCDDDSLDQFPSQESVAGVADDLSDVHEEVADIDEFVKLDEHALTIENALLEWIDEDITTSSSFANDHVDRGKEEIPSDMPSNKGNVQRLHRYDLRQQSYIGNSGKQVNDVPTFPGDYPTGRGMTNTSTVVSRVTSSDKHELGADENIAEWSNGDKNNQREKEDGEEDGVVVERGVVGYPPPPILPPPSDEEVSTNESVSSPPANNAE